MIVVGALAAGVVGFVVFATLTGINASIVVVLLAAVTVVVALAIQAVPHGRAHSNPPVTGEPAWASAETRELMVRACYGCHSNEVEYPVYASIAPISWVIESHVSKGRSRRTLPNSLPTLVVLMSRWK